MKKQEADILAQQQAVGERAREFEDPEKEAREIVDREQPPNRRFTNGPARNGVVIEILTAALDKGLATPVNE